MVQFDEKKIIENADYIYSQRDRIEAIADDICEKGFDLLFFTSSGGSMAMMEPFKLYLNQMTKLRTESMVSADLLSMGCNQISDRTVAFLTSKSGDTVETMAAAGYLKEKGVSLVSVVGVENYPMEKISDD